MYTQVVSKQKTNIPTFIKFKLNYVIVVNSYGISLTVSPYDRPTKLHTQQRKLTKRLIETPES